MGGRGPVLAQGLSRMSTRSRLFSLLAQEDELIEATGGRSLSPDRARATTLVALGERHIEALPAEAGEAVLRALLRSSRAQRLAFPGNIFWDFDAYAASLAESARNRPLIGAGSVSAKSALYSSLQSLFGKQTPIHFQYVHDFMYGFDWAKWVAKDPVSRAGVGPFDETFMQAIWLRGHELLQLIAKNDQEYPRLPSGLPRNPFSFARAPADERKLFVTLREANLLPVRAFEEHPTPVWNRDFQAERKAIAVREQA